MNHKTTLLCCAQQWRRRIREVKAASAGSMHRDAFNHAIVSAPLCCCLYVLSHCRRDPSCGLPAVGPVRSRPCLLDPSWVHCPLPAHRTAGRLLRQEPCLRPELPLLPWLTAAAGRPLPPAPPAVSGAPRTCHASRSRCQSRRRRYYCRAVRPSWSRGLRRNRHLQGRPCCRSRLQSLRLCPSLAGVRGSSHRHDSCPLCWAGLPSRCRRCPASAT